MSMKTHRDWARETKGIDKPNIVCPITAHPAFDKAAAYFKIHIIHVPVSEFNIHCTLYNVHYSRTNKLRLVKDQNFTHAVPTYYSA